MTADADGSATTDTPSRTVITDTVEDRLRRLAASFAAGRITDEEFAQAKAALLRG